MIDFTNVCFAYSFVSPPCFSSCLSFSFISASAPRSPKVAFSTLFWIFLTAFFVLSASTLCSFLAASFSSMGSLDRPVIDRTGLSGRFDFAIEWTPEPGNRMVMPGTTFPADEHSITFLEALKEQLGLKLEPATAPLDILVVDHVELPSEN